MPLTPFKEALGKLAGKGIVTGDLGSSEFADLPVGLRERAFFSARTTNAHYLQEVKDRVGEILEPKTVLRDGRPVTEGMNAATARAELKKILQGLSYQPDPGKAGTIQDLSSDARLNLLLKTQTEMAQGYGQYLQAQNADVLDAFPAQELFRAEERKDPRDWPTRWMQAGGQIFEGRMIALKNDPIWSAISEFDTPFPPFDFNSGMWTRDVDRAEAESLGLLKAGEEVKPAVEDFNATLKASVRDVDAALLQSLKESLGDQVKVEKGVVWWKGDKGSKALAVDPKPKAPKIAKVEPAPVPEKPAREFPESLSQVEKVKSLGGSTGAELVRDRETGAQFVQKRGNSAAHLREEFAADSIYRAMGVPVPEAKIVEEHGKPVKIAKFIDGRTLNEYLKGATAAERTAVTGKLQQHFAADALMGNWDVAGLGLDNVVVDAKGTPWRIDNGGALRYRAQGTVKNAEQWNAFPSELWSMRDAAANPSASKLFGDLDIYAIARQVQGIEAEKLLAAAPAEVKPLLQQRLQHLQDVARKALEYEATAFKAPYADQVTRHVVGIRQAGAMENVAAELKQGHAGDVRPVDAAGVPFDRLRTVAGVQKADPSQVFFDDIVKAVKTVNAHHAKGDTAYNASTLAKAASHKAALEKLVASGSMAEKMMGAHYLQFLERIESAKGNTASKVTQFDKFPMPVSKAGAKGRSSVSDFADYVKSNGGDWDIVANWASEQGGSSSSEHSRALMSWLQERLHAQASDFHEAPSPDALAKMRRKWGDKYDRTFEMFHAFVQETLGRVAFTGNDQAARLLRVLRTEKEPGVVPFTKGKSGDYPRRVNASGSVFAPVFGGTRTITVVPHTRVTGIYFFERTPGTGHYFFYGDSENEATYIGQGLKARNLGKNASPNLSPGTDHTKWEL